jgi:quinol monooxygenase YgiN
VLLVCRFTVADAERFIERVVRALELLTAQPGCLRGVLARSTESAQRWVLTVEWASVTAYRRALSPVAVREHVVPLLSEADVEETAAYETVLAATPDGLVRHTSLLAADADTVALGEAGGPTTPR